MPLVARIITSSMLLCVFTLNAAQSATQGDVNPTSSGDFTVTITIPDRVRISGLSNFTFGQYSGSGNVSQDDDICVYTNTPLGRYDITATGSGAGGAFTITNGAQVIPYDVLWNDVAGTVGQENLSAGVTRPARTGANSQSETCAVGGDSANLEIQMDEADIRGNPNGAYTGTITILIEPN